MKHLIGPLLWDDAPSHIYDKYTFIDKDFFTDEEKEVKAFLHKNNKTFFPRHAVSDYDKISLSEGKKIKINCNAKPRNNIQKQVVKFIVDNDDCLVNLAPGKGKTIISIMAICKIKRKTLVLVDQNFLIQQWKKRIVEFTDLKDDDIGLLQANKEILDKPIVISTIQTLKNKVKNSFNETREKLKDFGIVIVDEVHTVIGTEKFNQSLFLISSKRLIGLTATLYRYGNRDFLFYDWFGSKVYSNVSDEVEPVINIVKFKSNLTNKTVRYILNNYTKTNNNEFKNKVFFNKLKWTNALINDRLTIIKISALIYKLYKEKRTILVISSYVDILQVISKYLVETFGVELNNIELFTDSIGSLKKVKKIIKNTGRKLDKPITLSTYKMCNKAVDRPDWDTLVMLTPISYSSSSLEQTIGRVCRKINGKNKSYVYDLCDTRIQESEKMMLNRVEHYYSQKKYVINEITI